MAPNTNIFDNDNENSIDPNPYAYPYFHSNESTPLLYHLIVTHFGNSSDPLLLNHYQSLLTSSTTDADADTTTDSGTGAASSSAWSSASSQMTSPGTGMLHSEKTIARRIKFIGRRIQSRCKGRPQEAKWVDSCGENALFRFCQLVRFRKEMEGDEDVLERIQKMDADLASSSYYSSPSKRKLKLDSTAELIFFILKCLINVDKNALSTLNKWGETPLHQFVGHCGFDFDYQNNSTSASSTSAACAAAKTKHNHGLSYLFLELMLKASPNTVHQTNFQSAIPLHAACSLAQINSNQPFSALDSMVSMDKFLMSEVITRSDGQSRQSHQHRPHYADDHLQIIRRLVEYYPRGVLAIDMNGCTPLYRAVDSIHCSCEVVSFLLNEMENSFMRITSKYTASGSDNTIADVSDDSGHGDGDLTVKFLFYKAIMGLEVKNTLENDDNRSNSNNDNNWRRHYQHQNSALETRVEEKKVLSPMEGLWKAVLIRRQVKHEIPYLKDDITCASIADVIDKTLNEHNDDIGENVSVREKASNLAIQLGHTWEKIIHLICCAFHGSMKVIGASGGQQQKEKLLAVHAGIYCAAPSSILNLLLQLYPEDLLKCDKDGNTPLVLSIVSPSYKEQWEDKVDFDGSDENNYCTDRYSRTKQILKDAPEASTIMNTKGRLPLHIAIGNKMHWDDGVKDIFMANPAASSIKDPESHLLPFMLASRNDTYSSPVDSLTNAFTLLRADPSVLNMYIMSK